MPLNQNVFWDQSKISSFGHMNFFFVIATNRQKFCFNPLPPMPVPLFCILPFGPLFAFSIFRIWELLITNLGIGYILNSLFWFYPCKKVLINGPIESTFSVKAAFSTVKKRPAFGFCTIRRWWQRAWRMAKSKTSFKFCCVTAEHSNQFNWRRPASWDMTAGLTRESLKPQSCEPPEEWRRRSDWVPTKMTDGMRGNWCIF